MVLVALDETTIGLPVPASRPINILAITHLGSRALMVPGMHGEQDGLQHLQDRGPRRNRIEQ